MRPGVIADFVSFCDLALENRRILLNAFTEDKECKLDVSLRGLSSSFGVLVACGPSSKVIAMYGPSTLTSVNVIFSMLEEFGVGEVAANAKSCATAAA